MVKLFLISFFISFLVTIPVFKALAIKLKIVDMPDGKLKKHQVATPYLGGAAIFISLWSVLFFVCSASQFWAGLFLGTLVIFTAGLVDDLIALCPRQKIIMQLFTAAVLVGAGYSLDLRWPYYSGQVLSIFWLISMMNAFNLVDVMDGLATTIGIWSSLGLSYYAFLAGQSDDLLNILAVLLGSLIAFFCYNKPRAQIYLGDAGSMLLGAVIAATALKINWESIGNKSLINYLAAPTLVAIPALEVASLILIRRFKRIPFYNGSRDHFAHYLKNKQWSEWLILIYVSCYAILLFMLSALVVLSKFSPLGLLFVSTIIFLIWILIVFVSNDFWLR